MSESQMDAARRVQAELINASGLVTRLADNLERCEMVASEQGRRIRNAEARLREALRDRDASREQEALMHDERDRADQRVSELERELENRDLPEDLQRNIRILTSQLHESEATVAAMCSQLERERSDVKAWTEGMEQGGDLLRASLERTRQERDTLRAELTSLQNACAPMILELAELRRDVEPSTEDDAFLSDVAAIASRLRDGGDRLEAYQDLVKAMDRQAER